MKIAILQLASAGFSGADANLEGSLAAIDRAGAAGPDLILLPEATYPAYLLGQDWRERGEILSWQRLRDILGARAKLWGTHICLGYANKDRGTNAGLVVSPAGEVVYSFAKNYLWYFDTHWFQRGRPPSLWEAPWGRIGGIICADARFPESIRLLALGGAALVLDLAGLVAVGNDFSNPQLDYLLPVRAAENGLHLALAGKVGLEGKLVRYAGGSAVFSPRGEPLLQAQREGEEILLLDLELEAGVLPVPRRPELYGDLLGLGSEFGPCPEPFIGAALQLPQGFCPEDVPWNNLRAVGVSLILLPAGGIGDLATYRQISAQDSWTLVVPVAEEALVLEKGGIMGSQRATHGPNGRGGDKIACIQTGRGRLGIMLGNEGLVPEVARILALQGAETLCWIQEGPTPLTPLAFARARADENRINFLLAANLPGTAAVLAAGGGVLSRGGLGEIRAVMGPISPDAARDKEIVPGTDVFKNRCPEDYLPLVANR